MQKLLFTDPHLSVNNIPRIVDEFAQIRKIAKDNGIKKVICLGDMFESRTAQPQDVLNTLHEELEKFAGDNISLDIIPGNHDKADYESENSYLDQYTHHPKVRIISKYYVEDDFEKMFHYIPYFDENTTYPQYLKQAVDTIKEYPNPGIKHYLFTHVDVLGSVNNDKENSEEGIDINSFKPFTQAFVGHYHDKQHINNVFYMGSTSPRNYSEDNDKGIIIINDDGTYQERHLKCPKYFNLKIDLDMTDITEREELLQRYAEEVKSGNFVRFVFFSKDYDTLKSIDKLKYRAVGIEVKTIIPSITEGLELVKGSDYKSFTKDEIKSLFKQFIKEKKITQTKQEYGNRKLSEIL